MKIIKEPGYGLVLENATSRLRSDPEVRAIMLTGSFSRGEEEKNSDLDFLVITKRRFVERKAEYVNGIEVQYLAAPPKQFDNWLEYEKGTATSTIIGQLSEGVILYDPSGVAAEYQNRARRILEEGPRGLTPQQIRSKRRQLTDAADDVEDRLGSPSVALWLMNTEIGSAIESYLALNGHWAIKPKYLLTKLKNMDESLYNKCQDFLAENDVHRKYVIFRGIVEQVLKPFGGFLHEGWENAPEEVK
jgi:predicted nucleotidyltransferase